MKIAKHWLIWLMGLLLLANCSPQLPVLAEETGFPEVTDGAVNTATLEDHLDTSVPEFTSTPQTTVLNPLTGLPVQNIDLLSMRPLIVKVQNVPRESRPQWGLSLADHVYEYYIEYGDTRFAAIYYGTRPEQIGPIRSARHFDMQLIQMYQAVLLYGGAYEELQNEMLSAEFGNRIIREGENTQPAFYRYDPAGMNYLMINTTLLEPVYSFYNIENIQPEFIPVSFNGIPDRDGSPADVVFVRFSGSMYNRWDYSPETGRYYRSSETQSGLQEEYAPLYDRFNGEQIAADNLVILFTRYNQVLPKEEVFDIPLMGSGTAYAMRDGKLFELTWSRSQSDALVFLQYADGTPYSFKQGNTWFSVLGSQSNVEQQQRNWKFTCYLP